MAASTFSCSSQDNAETGCYSGESSAAYALVSERTSLLAESKASSRSVSPTVSTSSSETLERVRMGNPTNFSSNTLLVYRLQEMKDSANINLWLACLCLVYMGTNITLLFVNYVDWKYDQSNPLEDDPPVDDTIFHLVEFWATFGFAIVECLALANTPKSLFAISGDQNPLPLRVVMFFNIVATAVPALLVSFSIETFEILSHEIEYVNELTMSFVDVILLVSLWNSKTRGDGSNDDKGRKSTFLNGKTTTAIAFLVALIQLGVYNGMGYDEEKGDMVGETLGHFLEFYFEIFSSAIAFWFCMDNKFLADTEIGLVLYGYHEECRICEAQFTEFSRMHGSNVNNIGGRSTLKKNNKERIDSSAPSECAICPTTQSAREASRTCQIV